MTSERQVELNLQNVMSRETSFDGDVSAEEQIILIDNLILEDEPLLDANLPQRRQFGNFRVDTLVLVCYQYIRLLLSLGLLVYVGHMLLSKEKKSDVFYSRRRLNEPDINEYSSKDIRVVVCVVLVFLFGPNKLSVLFNLLHRKTVTQLQFTVIFTIVFIVNCFDDSFDYSGIVFLQRERQDRQARLFGDIYYGFST